MGTETAEQPLTPREAALLKQMGEMQALILKLEEKIARLEGQQWGQQWGQVLN